MPCSSLSSVLSVFDGVKFFLHHHMNDVNCSKIFDIVCISMGEGVTLYHYHLCCSVELVSDIVRACSVDALSFSGS